MFKPNGRRTRRVGVVSVLVLVAASAAWAGGGPAAGAAVGPDGTTTRVSVSSNETQSNAGGIGAPAISQDGRYAVFVDRGSHFAGGDTNDANDVFVRDRTLGITRRMSMSSSGVHGNNGSFAGAISGDGRYVAFRSTASNLVPGDTNGFSDVFVRDRTLGTTSRVSVSSSEHQGNQDHDNTAPSISPDGRYVAWSSFASNLVRGDTNGRADVFVRDRMRGTTIRVSVSSNQRQGNQDSLSPVLSADGRRVVFYSDASNLVASDTNDANDVFLWYRPNGTTRRVSLSNNESQGNARSWAPASVSPDGRYVAFASQASNLVAGDTLGQIDVFVRDRLAGTTKRVSVGTDGTPADQASLSPSISANGQRVAFYSNANNLVEGDIISTDVFVRDRVAGTTRLVSVKSDETQGNDVSDAPAISGDGRHVAFQSYASNLVPEDTNERADTFVRVLEP